LASCPENSVNLLVFLSWAAENAGFSEKSRTFRKRAEKKYSCRLMEGNTMKILQGSYSRIQEPCKLAIKGLRDG
jgi:hypothetical protein